MPWKIVDADGTVVLFDRGVGLGAEGSLGFEFEMWRNSLPEVVEVTPTGPFIEPPGETEAEVYLMALAFLEEEGVRVGSTVEPQGVDRVLGEFDPGRVY